MAAGSSITSFVELEDGVLPVPNATAEPASNPIAGSLLYSYGGELWYRGTSGKVGLTGPFYNVKWFGAKGDGVTNDSAAVNALVASLAGGGTVYFPPGTYLGRFGVAVNNVNIMGAGRGATTLKLPNSTNAAAQVLTLAADYCSVRDLSVDGNKANQAVDGNPVVTHRQSDGISIYGSYNAVENVYVKSTQAHGIIVWDEATSAHGGAPNVTRAAGARSHNTITRNTVEDNGVTGNERTAIDLATGNDSRRNVVAFNHILAGSATSSGVTCHGGSENVIIGNAIEGTSVTTIYGVIVHTTAFDTSVIGNQYHTDQPVYFLELQNCKRVTAVGNVFSLQNDSGANGGATFIDVNGGCTDVVASANVFYSRYSVARFMTLTAGTAANVLLADNIIRLLTSTFTAVVTVNGTPTVTNVAARNNMTGGVDLLTRIASGSLTGTVDYRDNIGLKTENNGTATVASGTTSIAVTHGLALTPVVDDISVTPTNLPTNNVRWYVSAVSATTFTITTSADPGAGGATFAWAAVIQ